MHKLIPLLILVLCSCEPKSNPAPVNPPSPPPYEPTYTADFLMGKFDPTTHPDFMIIDRTYADQEGRIMHKGAYEAFKKMHAAAAEESVNFTIRSATRNFDYQKGIWEKKWTGKTILSGGINATDIQDPVERAKEILKFSSMPGTSRHHWGTDIDLNAFTNSYFESGRGKKEFEWLQKNAANFGFCRSYTQKSPEGRATGYEEEKWHWSYIPLSKGMIKDASLVLRDSMISGFQGSETAQNLSVVENYILGVDFACK